MKLNVSKKCAQAVVAFSLGFAVLECCVGKVGGTPVPGASATVVGDFT